MIRFLFSFLRLFLPHYTHTTLGEQANEQAKQAVQLPPGMPRETFDRMWAVGYDTDTAAFLADFDLLTCTTFTGATR